MKAPNSVHERHPWEIHRIAHDFELLDVWELPVEGGRNDFPAFLEALASIDPTKAGSLASRTLFWVRGLLGELFGWDRHDRERPIPSSNDMTLASRVPEHLRGTTTPTHATLRMAGAVPLYRTDDEAALEISNETVHGVIHLGWIERDGGRHGAQMAIYVRPRGLLGRSYMALIAPFRHLIVYPSLMKTIGRAWERRVARR